jgi:crotonobetainyl-CoA:carnitine CoA-transferase CaiB-like acyl-CoA transferase
MIADVLRGDDAQAWITKLQAAGVPCGRINSVAEALDDPHTAARRMVETVEHPTVGALRLLGIPFGLNGTPATVRRPPPTLGQHTDEILGEELGLSAERIGELRARKVT